MVPEERPGNPNRGLPSEEAREAADELLPPNLFHVALPWQPCEICLVHTQCFIKAKTSGMLQQKMCPAATAETLSVAAEEISSVGTEKMFC